MTDAQQPAQGNGGRQQNAAGDGFMRGEGFAGTAGGGASAGTSSRGRGRSLRQRRGFGRDSNAAGGGSEGWPSAAPGQVREVEMQSMGQAAEVSGAKAEQMPAGKHNGNGDKDHDHRATKKCAPGYADFSRDEEELASILAEAQEDDDDVGGGDAESPSGATCGGGTAQTAEANGSPTARRGGGAAIGSEGRGKGAAAAAGAGLREQLRWLLWKRRVVAQRDWRGGLYQIILPAVMVALVLVLLTIDVKLAGPPLAMSAGMFGSPTQVGWSSLEGVTGCGEGGAGRSAARWVSSEGRLPWLLFCTCGCD